MKINTTDKAKCCGCGACVVVCPQSCIRSVQDDEGFEYPVIDDASCIECGRCLAVCGMQNDPALREVKQTYAAWHTDPKLRAQSTSGGVFSAIAEAMFAGSGLVAGAAFSANFRRVEHQLVYSWREAEAFRGSKYVQSQTEECFAAIVKTLDAGKEVLFTGTPCQVASLRRLTNDHKNLFTCDIVCHGVPSPDLFESYLAEIEQRRKSRITSYAFREKVHGWNFPMVVVTFENGDSERRIPWADPFFCGFSLNVFLRPSCYSCPFATERRVGDVTLADCWRVAASHPQFDDNGGTSLVLVNSAKGHALVKRSKESVVRYDYNFDLACQRNQPLQAPPVKFSGRELFFSEYKKNKIFKQAAQSYQSPWFVAQKKVKWFVKRLFWPVLRRLQ